MKKSVIKILGIAALGFTMFSTGCSSREEMEDTYKEDSEGGTAEAILHASDDSNSVNQGKTGGTIIGAADTLETEVEE